MEGTNNEPMGLNGPAYIGLDVHKRTSTATFLDQSGLVLYKGTYKTRPDDLKRFADMVPTGSKIGLEASTAGKAVFRQLQANGLEVQMGAPRKIKAISDCDIKTDKRDSLTLANLVRMDYFPKCYVPPPHIDTIRQLVRFRRDLAQSAGSVKNQIQALVVKNLFQCQMEKFSDWFGKGGLQSLIKLPFNDEDRYLLGAYLGQLKTLIEQEEDIERRMAKLGEDSEDVKLLMTIPGIGYYTALALIGEIGDARRYPTKRHLASDAGLVPRADNSGETVSKHSKCKKGNGVLKFFLCSAVNAVVKSNVETTVKNYYHKKAKQIGEGKARVAAARKLSAIVWKILTSRQPYQEEDKYLTERKMDKMEKKAKKPSMMINDEELSFLAEGISSKSNILERMTYEENHDDEDTEKNK